MQYSRRLTRPIAVRVARNFASKSDLVVTSTKNAVTTIRMNDPKKLNGWTTEMTDAFFGAIKAADVDAETKVIVLTGTDPYYCAGVNLAGER
jgi:Delta3-Delta2-enoyl-CoA isomerase